MYNELLQQVPLTVSPFVSLPTATTLPYTYKSLPSTLPPSSTGLEAQPGQEKPKYIVSSSGLSATPEDIIASCQKLQDYLKKTQNDAEKSLADWEKAMQERDLAEKRRVAPGWLDSDARILQPEKTTAAVTQINSKAAMSLMDASDESQQSAQQNLVDDAAGLELDRAFGGVSLKNG